LKKLMIGTSSSTDQRERESEIWFWPASNDSHSSICFVPCARAHR
jgi:hypothetical protein